MTEPTARPSFAARAKKALVAAVGVVAMVATTKGLEEDAEVWVNAILAVATAFGVYQVPNKQGVAERNIWH